RHDHCHPQRMAPRVDSGSGLVGRGGGETVSHRYGGHGNPGPYRLVPGRRADTAGCRLFLAVAAPGKGVFLMRLWILPCFIAALGYGSATLAAPLPDDFAEGIPITPVGEGRAYQLS